MLQRERETGKSETNGVRRWGGGADGLSQWRPARGTGAGHVTGGYQGDVIALGVRMKGARGRSTNQCRERERAGLTLICGTERGKDQEPFTHTLPTLQCIVGFHKLTTLTVHLGEA